MISARHTWSVTASLHDGVDARLRVIAHHSPELKAGVIYAIWRMSSSSEVVLSRCSLQETTGSLALRRLGRRRQDLLKQLQRWLWQERSISVLGQRTDSQKRPGDTRWAEPSVG